MVEKLTVRPTEIQGVFVAETTPFADHRGAFARFFCADELAPVLGERSIVQINHSRTREVGAVRGMHFQRPPHAEMKLVRCVRGRVFDVALDLRADSPTFLRWHAEPLDPTTARMLVVPEGCAHGFQVLEEESEILYMVTEFYSPESEEGVHPEDPMISIQWPLPVRELSRKDACQRFLTPSYTGLVHYKGD